MSDVKNNNCENNYYFLHYIELILTRRTNARFEFSLSSKIIQTL